MMTALFCLTYFSLAVVGVPFGYHRMLAHRAFVLPRPLRWAVVFLGLPAGTPVQWVGNHRRHHQYADREGDPHSPHVGGFWFAHVGWYLGTSRLIPCIIYALGGPGRMLFDAWYRPRSNQQWKHLAQDVSDDPFYSWLSRRELYTLLVGTHALSLVASALVLGGGQALLAVWATSVLVYNLGDSIDSVGHLLGKRPFGGTDQARNNRILSLLTFGEGWHSNHHAFPTSARHGLLPGQVDPLYQLIRFLRFLGIASEVNAPSRRQVRERLGS